ncbi:LysM peptidoglycan-binding domain-containing protein [bacterium]|nr:LysM peptidoglycan-binding domain-containing protein [bacterium]
MRIFYLFLSVFFLITNSVMAQTTDSSFEARMHRIYKSHYQTPILDDDWIQIVKGIQEQSYKVSAGDTLWDISEIYFGDGNYWSKLWSMNRNITNPHLIFTGDTIIFSVGSFDQAPSISVEKLEQQLAEAQQGSSPTVVIEPAPVLTTKGKFYNTPPDFFIESPILNLGDTSSISIIPRPKMQYKNDFYLTSEIFSTEPEAVATVKSIGGERMVSGESNRIILQTDDGSLSEGATLSVIDDNIDYLKGGYGIHVLAIVKVLNKISDQMYETEVLRQFDGLKLGAQAIAHIPSYVNMNSTNTPTEVNVSILSKDKEIWYTGDIIYLKSEEQTVNNGDVLKIHNRFDKNVDFFTQNGLLKVVSSKPPFATAVVMHARTALDRNSVSSPKKSEKSFW